jgi:hypothetical protein
MAMRDGELIAIGRSGARKRLVKIGHVDDFDHPVAGAPTFDESGSLITVEHKLDPEAQKTLETLRKGTPVAAAVGGAVVGILAFALILYMLNNSGESREEE